jgi:FkbM family methyltransferase
MLIGEDILISILEKNNIKVDGVLHIGAHDCEEMFFYLQRFKLHMRDVFWIDAIERKVKENINKGFPNIYQAAISDKDNEDVTFRETNNVASSSFLEMETHLIKYPGIHVVNSYTLKTTTIDTFIKNNQIDLSKLNFWNIDIQGVELLALRGGEESLKHAKALYLEINVDHLYKNGALVHEIDEFLKPRGFDRVYTYMTGNGWGDAIYIRRA